MAIINGKQIRSIRIKDGSIIWLVYYLSQRRASEFHE